MGWVGSGGVGDPSLEGFRFERNFARGSVPEWVADSSLEAAFAPVVHTVAAWVADATLTRKQALVPNEIARKPVP